MRDRIFIVLATLISLQGAAAAQVTYSTFELRTRDTPEDNWRLLDTTEEEEFFGLAACCSAELAVRVKRGTNPQTTGDQEVALQVWVGKDCDTDNIENRDRYCRRVDDETNPVDLGDVYDQEFDIPIDVTDIILAGSTHQMCTEVPDIEQNLYLLADTDAGGAFELEALYPKDLLVDTMPPTGVDMVTTKGVEDGVALEWDVEDTASDIDGYQVYCRGIMGVAERPLLADRGFERAFRVAECVDTDVTPPTPDAGTGIVDAGPPPDADPLAPDAAPPDAMPPPPDAAAPGMDGGSTDGWDDLDPTYLCSGPIAATATSFRVELDGVTLADGEEIEVKLVVYDRNGNHDVFDGLEPRVPQPVVDFWESYEGAGGQAEGGYCFVATAAFGDYEHPYVRVLRDFRDGTLAKTSIGRAFIRWYYDASPGLAGFIAERPWARFTARVLLAPIVLLAGAWEYTGAGTKLVVLALLVLLRIARRGWRRAVVVPRRAAVALATGAAVLFVLGGIASAQPVVFDDELDEGVSGPEPSRWAFELKLGPYTPGIDDEPGLTGRPYEEMFGDGESLLWQMELDRGLLFHRGGNLGVGASLGYMSNSAKSFEQGPDGMPSDQRSEDDNSIQVVPTSLAAVYRFTLLADETRVPLVPYGKLGLDYYFWFMTKGDGDPSSTPAKGEASGGTLGWHGTLGLAFRIDALDPGAAQAMRSELDVEHVGVFVEMTYADVSGLGMDNKLYLGDFTWAAGVNFEF